ncbi:MAG: S1C family serine protease [Gammaproteobacteria bacterium]|nr:S1C family serine protease [Gammaproteobacteria bacterium]
MLEASELWLSSDGGETAPAHLIAQDVESGLALVRPDISIGSAIYRFGDGATSAGQSVRVVNGAGDPALSCNVFAVGEFAGRWEYLIDEAIYTVPACDNWSGAALVDMHGGLIGVGSLFLELPGGGGKPVYGNLFVPVSLIAPHIDDLCLHGTRRTAPLPWMGWMVQDHKGSAAGGGHLSRRSGRSCRNTHRGRGHRGRRRAGGEHGGSVSRRPCCRRCRLRGRGDDSQRRRPSGHPRSYHGPQHLLRVPGDRAHQLSARAA